MKRKTTKGCFCGYAFGDREQAVVCSQHAQELMNRIHILESLGDALASTGGQHGFDEALDNWNQIRGQ
jgi:hypothetical protein